MRSLLEVCKTLLGWSGLERMASVRVLSTTSLTKKVTAFSRLWTLSVLLKPNIVACRRLRRCSHDLLLLRSTHHPIQP